MIMYSDLLEETTPIDTAFRPSTIAKLCDFMNVKGKIDGVFGYYNNYLGLAELAGLSKRDIDSVKSSANPTEFLLEEWPRIWMQRKRGTCTVAPTIGKLCKHLLQLGRDDVIQALENYIREDIKTFKAEFTYESEEMKHICRDLTTGEKLYYDGFVAFDEMEAGRIIHIVKLLEKDGDIKLFFEPRDMPPGVPNFPAQAYIMEDRCTKLLCFITKTFSRNPSCNFLVRFVQHSCPDGSNKKILPVILDKESQIPEILSTIVTINFSSLEIQDFTTSSKWDKLRQALKPVVLDRPVASISPLPPDNMASYESHAISLPASEWRQGSDSRQSMSGALHAQETEDEVMIPCNQHSNAPDHSLQTDKTRSEIGATGIKPVQTCIERRKKKSKMSVLSRRVTRLIFKQSD